MPFQSEKQRRFLHANHPEIAKRWEREYATGGISNHFRRKFFTGALADTQGPAGGQAMSPGTSTTGGSRNLGGGQGGQGNQGGGGGPKPHSGPSFAEIEAQKKAAAAAALEKKNLAAWEHSQTLKQNKKERIKKTKYLKGLLKNDPLYDTYVAKGLLDWDNIKPYESDPKLKTDESLKAKQKGWWGYTRPYLGFGENLYISNLEEFGQEPKGPLHATRSGRWNETIAEKNKRIAETIGHEARHQVLGADVPAIIGDPYSGKVNEALYEQGFVDENTFDLPGKGTHELINTMGDFQAYNNPTIYDDIYGKPDTSYWKDDKTYVYSPEIKGTHGVMPRHLSSPVADQLYDASTQFTKDTKARHEGEKYANLDPVLVEGLKQQYPDVDVEWALRDMDAKEVISELADVYYAKGGVARKNYYHGGILDINESEEIISDDGNDIELTDYNAAFDDPNDLSTGVKSLFQAKDGGRTNYIYGGISHPDGRRGFPGGAGTPGGYGGGADSGSTGGNQGGGWSPGVGHSGSPTSTGGDTSRTRIQKDKAEDERKKAADLAFSRSPAADEEKYDSWEQMVQDKYTGQGLTTETPHFNIQKSKVILNKAREDWNAVKDKFNEKYKKKVGTQIVRGLLNMGVTFGIGDIIGMMVDGYKTNKAKQEFISDIKTQIKNYTDLGLPTHSPHTDTLIQTLNQEILDLTQKSDKDDDTGGDGPELPKVVPVGEEIEGYQEMAWNPMGLWNSIKQKQALNAQLQEKWAAEQEAYDQSFLVANSGGLANLFRVKNNQ